jgi:hypothetical protein
MMFGYDREDIVSLLMSLGIALKLKIYTHDRLSAERIENAIFGITKAIDEKLRKGLTEKESEEMIKFLELLFLLK